MKLNNSFKSLLFATVLGTSVVMSSCDKDDEPIVTPPPPPTATPTIAAYVTADTSFSILLAAVKKAGLAVTLSDPAGTFTVFAPTNAAFRAASITEATIATFDTASVKAIILYHALGSKVLAAGVPVSDTVKTLNGKNLFASSNANGVFLNGVKVVTPNVTVSNGVIHVIGSVLTPPIPTIAQFVVARATAPVPEFSYLLAAVARAGLVNALSSAGKYTVFAPTNAAFIDAGFPTAAAITGSDSATVRRIVLAHVLGTNVFAGDLIAGATANTLNPVAVINPQQTLTVGVNPASVRITAAPASILVSPITTANNVTTNGVIHVISKVLLQ